MSFPVNQDKREVMKRCLSYKIVEEVPVIKYQLETNCVFSYDKNGNIVPNPSKEWTGGDENGKWRDKSRIRQVKYRKRNLCALAELCNEHIIQ